MGNDSTQNFVGDGRAQTLQDYALGIGIFIIAFMIVISMFPGMLSPFQSKSSGSETAQAEQAAKQIISKSSVGTQPNQLQVERVEPIFTQSESELLERFGLPSTENINVTIETLNASTHIYASQNEVYQDELATYSRIITLVDADGDQLDECTPACLLVVRVW